MVGRELRLFEGEKVTAVLTPHPISFYSMHLLWVYMILLSAAFFLVSDALTGYVGSPTQAFTLGFFGKADSPLISKTPIVNVFAPLIDKALGGTLSFSVKYGIVFFWLTLLFIPSLFYSIMRISWKWTVYTTSSGIASIILVLLSGMPEKTVYVVASVFGVCGMLLVDLYRRGHHYIITNNRLITDVRFIYNVRDDISYDKVNNLVMNQSLLGRIFDFGTVMPLTASGLGTGSDFTAVTIGGGKSFSEGAMVGGALTGGRSINLPRGLSQFSLVGVRHPRTVIDNISEFVHEDNEAPYLKKMSDDMGELLGEVKGRRKKTSKADDGL